MPLDIVRNDITKMKVDAIINPTNRALSGGGGMRKHRGNDDLPAFLRPQGLSGEVITLFHSVFGNAVFCIGGIQNPHGEILADRNICV